MPQNTFVLGELFCRPERVEVLPVCDLAHVRVGDLRARERQTDSPHDLVPVRQHLAQGARWSY